MFPFLIGRIRTIIEGEASDGWIAFPFLIGRIRTKTGMNKERPKIYVFPFLIGRIRTIL